MYMYVCMYVKLLIKYDDFSLHFNQCSEKHRKSEGCEFKKVSISSILLRRHCIFWCRMLIEDDLLKLGGLGLMLVCGFT